MSSNETLPGLVIADSFPVMQWALQRYLSEECGRQVLAVVGDSDSLVERRRPAAGKHPDHRAGLAWPAQPRRYPPGGMADPALPANEGDGLLGVQRAVAGQGGPAQRRLGLHQQAQPAGDVEGGAGVHGARTDLPRPRPAPAAAYRQAAEPHRGGHPPRLARGDTVSEIAQRTMRSVSTISTHKKNAMVKIGLNSDAELIALGVMNWLHELA